MEPPIQTEYFLSGGAMILILMVEGARAVISFCMRSAIPGYMVVPPDMTVLAYRSFLMSTSHFMMELKVVSWMPQASIPRKLGWKRASGHLNLSSPWTLSRRCPLPPPPLPWRSPTSFPTARRSPSATRGSGAPRPSSSPASWEWRPAASTRPPPTPSCPEAPPCTPVLLTACRRRSLPWLPPPSRSR